VQISVQKQYPVIEEYGVDWDKADLFDTQVALELLRSLEVEEEDYLRIRKKIEDEGGDGKFKQANPKTLLRKLYYLADT
jgi:hypothetical protein